LQALQQEWDTLEQRLAAAEQAAAAEDARLHEVEEQLAAAVDANAAKDASLRKQRQQLQALQATAAAKAACLHQMLEVAQKWGNSQWPRTVQQYDLLCNAHREFSAMVEKCKCLK
jgi:predicted  nucleic acid-binding Zn-ribbon protein